VCLWLINYISTEGYGGDYQIEFTTELPVCAWNLYENGVLLWDDFSYEPYRESKYCPVNSTASGNNCQCNSGYVEGKGAQLNQCILASEVKSKWQEWCSAASGMNIESMSVLGKSATSGCLSGIDIAGSPIDTPGYEPGDLPSGAGCSISVGGTAISWQEDDGKWWTTGTKITVTGGTCVEGSTDSAGGGSGSEGVIPDDAPSGTVASGSAKPTSCPVGQTSGQVNGTTVCAPMGSNTATSSVSPGSGTNTVTNPDGSSVRNLAKIT
jgi:hypothetical protein